MNPFQKWLLLGSSLATGVTGVVYWFMEHLLQPVDPWAVINHPLQPLVLKLHILVAPLLVFAVGLIGVDHVWKHLRSSIRLSRRSGLTLVAVLLPMVVSGYLIQAFTAAAALSVAVWVHVVTGVVYCVALLVHHQVIRRRRRVRQRLGGVRWDAVGPPPGRPRGRGTPVA